MCLSVNADTSGVIVRGKIFLLACRARAVIPFSLAFSNRRQADFCTPQPEQAPNPSLQIHSVSLSETLYLAQSFDKPYIPILSLSHPLTHAIYS